MPGTAAARATCRAPRRPLRDFRSSWPLAMLLMGAASGCTLVGTGPADAPGPVVTDGPAIAEGPSTAERDRAAADLMTEGEARLARGDAAGARTLGREVASRYPEARGASRAFWIEARAEKGLGAWEAAENAATRFVEIVGTGTPEGAAAQALRAEARFREGRTGALEALFEVPATTRDPVRGETARLAREISNTLGDPALRDLIEEAPRHPWLLPVFLVELSSRRALVGDDPGARGLAESALILEPVEADRERATRILAGEVTRPEGAGTRVSGVLGAILAEEGSPGLRQLSQQVRDGVEVALLDERFRGAVQLRSADDGGSANLAGAALTSMEDGNAFAVLGPLTDPAVAEAARARRRALPIVSPTARSLPQGFEGVYSIAGADPQASMALADQAWRDGMRQVVVFHRDHPDEIAEYEWFRQAFEGRGGQVMRSWNYSQGATTFQDQLQAIARLQPRGLVVFLPPEDVELVAPQFAFYGVDDVADLRIYGGTAWTTQGVLQALPVRHTDGVHSVAPYTGEGFGPEWERFVTAYEAHFQRTLRSPVPALGWDAARIVLEAAMIGGSTPEGVARGLREIRDFPGATGTFSWIDGRLSRHYVPVRIENRVLVPLSDER
jgi:ABC-type branched-subunit amino acid transport system substrate-binding protein